MSATGPIHAATPTIPQQRILTLVLSPAAVCITYCRLYMRYRHGKLWWDDLWAFCGSCFAIAFVVVFILHIRDPLTNPMTQGAKVATYYFCPETFYSVAWTARISILFTIIRLSFGLLRKVLLGAAGLFFLCWFILCAQVFWVCVPEPTWKLSPLAQCDLGREVAITLIIMDVICDTVLIAAPMHLLWGARLQRSLKLRLIAVFAATAIMTAVSLYHDYTIYLYGGLAEAFAANLQVSVSLMVANLSVIAAFVFRLIRPQEDTTVRTVTGVLTFGGKSPKRARVTTFGGIETIVGGNERDPRLAVQVDISQTNDQVDDWTKGSTTMDAEEQENVEKVELQPLPPNVTRV
ncbi:hypothetical protein FB45DRAFT_939614 [Roridomyces roridus]|uniref:Rhodopsin domain-containing protein n=1 Tax=Roridomyces roridus TaxID=1738132 RepID=A0AAD7B7F0_9AGAR|nr:hypothetical protein FB45DRAFT_939614 [Roridomyces roridus]